MIIIGAGLSGLLAANILRKDDPIIYETQPKLPNNHTALLRHRTNIISEATSIPFREVEVTKAINYKGKIYNQPSIHLSNLYSQKVTGGYYSRSINNLKSVKRYIAPPDFIEKLSLGCNIKYNSPYDFSKMKPEDKTISTMPMPSLMDEIGLSVPFDFEYKNIFVITCDIEYDCDIYQTIYYPNPNLKLYRLSITGKKVIAEFVDSGECDFHPRHGVNSIEEYVSHFLESDFGISSPLINVRHKQNKYGKIKDVLPSLRKSIILKLTQECGIYSLGRYAIWKNILLDDVYKDVMVIKKLIDSKGYMAGDWI